MQPCGIWTQNSNIPISMKAIEKGKYPKQARNKRIAIMLNEREQRALENFCTRYNITNRSRLVRETLMRAILKKIDNDQPTLFD